MQQGQSRPFVSPEGRGGPPGCAGPGRLRDARSPAARHPGRPHDAVRLRGPARGLAASRARQPRRVDGRHRRLRRRLRVQLRGLLSAAGVACVLAWAGTSRAQVAEFDTTQTVFYEAPTRTHMFVYTPSGDVQVSPFSWLDVRGGWEADVVSGASVATKAGAAYEATHGADVITTASVHDFRNLARG